jgi:Na+-transporting NADH:ubiquinone oxidoreductase subunit F
MPLNKQSLTQKSHWPSTIRRFHKWLSLIVGVQVVIWMMSGLFMASINIDNIHGDQFIRAPQHLPTMTLVSIPEKYTNTKRVLLTQQLAKPVYIINRKIIIDAQSGQQIPITREYIKQRALESFAHQSTITHIEKRQQYPDELGGRNEAIWRVDFDELFSPTLYFSPQTGRLISKRSDLWRLYDFLWSLHIMDYEQGEDSHNTLLLIATLFALLMVSCGLWLMFYALKSPTAIGKVGLLTNVHRWLALTIGIQLLLWVVSGLTFNLMSSDTTKASLLFNKTPTVSFSPHTIDFNHIVNQFSNITSVSIDATSRSPLVYINNNKQLTPLTLSLRDVPLAASDIKKIAQEAINESVPIVSTTLMTPSHLESRKFKRLVWQVIFDNENDSALYVDAYSGRVLSVIENGWRIKDFFWMLHIMDYQGRSDFNHPLMVIAATIATIASLTGFILLFFSFRLNKNEEEKVSTAKITITDSNGDHKLLKVEYRQSLLAALADTDMPLQSGCGGKGTCGQCRVNIHHYQQPLNGQEKQTLSTQEISQGFRLGCQTPIKQDLTISLPNTDSSPDQMTATVISSQFKTPFIKELTLRLKGDTYPTFKAGQYININLPPSSLNLQRCVIPPQFKVPWQFIDISNLSVTSSLASQRSYSMANVPVNDGLITLNVKLALPTKGYTLGLGSSYLFNVQVGETLEINGPYGEFVINEDSEREIILVGAGSGIAPLKSLAEHAIQKKRQRISLWYGVRDFTDIIHQDHFDNLAKNNRHFQWRLSLSRPNETSWQGLTGYIQHHLVTGYLHKHKAINSIDFYLCGPKVMMDDTQQLLEKLGVTSNQIKRDSF